MREANILKRFFQDQLGANYNVEAFRNAVQNNAPPSETMRVIQTTDEIIRKTIESKQIRAVVRTSQSDYIGLREADGVSFTWSLEIAAPIDSNVDDDLTRIRLEWTDKIIPGEYIKLGVQTDYELLLTFTMPAKFITETINGIKYIQLVWGGRGTLVENSVLANGYSFYINGERIPGVLKLSCGYNPQGENYTTERVGHQRIAIQTFTNAVGLTIHAIKDNDVINNIVNASLIGNTKGFAFEIRQNDKAVAQWENAYLDQVKTEASLGSYVLIEAQIIRS